MIHKCAYLCIAWICFAAFSRTHVNVVRDTMANPCLWFASAVTAYVLWSVAELDDAEQTYVARADIHLGPW